MFHKIKSVAPLTDYRLLVTFAEGITKTYDVKPLFDRFDAFRSLRDVHGLYDLVHADIGGYGIAWNDEIDLACDELWENGTEVCTPFDNLISFGDATDLWGLNESTLRKAVSYGKLRDGIDVKKFGKQWVASMESMRREYGEPRKAGE